MLHTPVVWDLNTGRSVLVSVLIHHRWAVRTLQDSILLLFLKAVAVELDISDISDPHFLLFEII